MILLPNAVANFIQNGYRVLVEGGAGKLAGYADADYARMGAKIVDRDAAWTESNVILKYKAPGPEEYRYFRKDMHLASFMHAEGNLTMVEAMRASGMSAYALEFFRNAAGEYPVSMSDNEISGKLAVLLASYHLKSHMGGSGTLLAHVPGARRAKVVVIGYGNAGGCWSIWRAFGRRLPTIRTQTITGPTIRMAPGIKAGRDRCRTARS